MVDAYVSERRNAEAAEAFFRRVIAETDVRPVQVTTDKAACYPPALRAVLRDAKHLRSKYLNNGLERDRGHLKQPLYPMRGFKQADSVDRLARGHTFIQNRRNGFTALTTTIPRPLPILTAWSRLTQAI